MRKLILISLTVFVSVSFAMTELAFAERKVVADGRKLKKIEEKGAFLGIYMDELDRDMIKDLDYPKSSGVLVVGIVDDSPAEEAGLEKHDVIYSIEGEKVSDSNELGRIIRSREPGEKVELVVYRDGRKKTFDLELGEKKTRYVTIDVDDLDLAEDIYVKTLGKHGNLWMSAGDDHFSVINSRGRMGIQLHPLNEDLAPYFKVDAGRGVLVLSVLEDSPAEEAGIKAGDVIVGIDGEEIEEIDDVFEALDEMRVEYVVEFDEDLDEEDAEVEVEVEEDEAEDTIEVTVIRMGSEKKFEVELDDDFAMNRRYIIKGTHMPAVKYWDMPRMEKIYEMRELEKLGEEEQEKLEMKLRVLEKEMEKLQKKLEKMEKDD